MSKRISQLTSAATLNGAELVEVSKLSASVTITGTTISADSSDNSFNDSGNGFVTAGFTTGKSINVSGFTGNSANNITSGVVTSVAAGKIIIGGTDGDVIVTDAAGESVTITQWDSRRSTAQDIADLAGVAAGRDVLTAARTYYVRTDGSDSNNGLANTSGGAFLTIQKAIDVVSGSLDLVTYDVTINVGDGTRTAAVTLKRYLSGGGAVYLVGNATTPANCIISVTSGNCFTTSDFAGPYDISGFKLVTTTSGTGLSISGQASTVAFKNIDFGACATAHISVTNNGAASASGNYSITGAAPWHYGAFSNGAITVSSRTVTVTGTPAFSTAFCLAQTTGMVVANSITFSGSATGTRYNISLNAVVNTAGGGANYFPGNGAGSTATGGQYA